MKHLVLITSLVFVYSGLSPLFASTNVPASINTDTQWDRSGSPYLIQGKVTVAKGATLEIGPAIQVVFQAGSILEIDGVLKVDGSAAVPVVFNMTDGGMQSQLVISGGSAFIYNAKFMGGVLLVKDSKFRLQGGDITKGSGVYLQGSTLAYLNNNKVYGNSTGIVLDGKVKLYGQFNSLVQNTYGLYVKSYSLLKFTNNSIHDNQMEVVNNTPSFNLGKNYWGTTDSGSIHARIQGSVDLTPIKTLKDVWRVYITTQLPVITAKMANALEAKEKREATENAVALKKFREQQAMEAQNIASSTLPVSATAQAPSAPGLEGTMAPPLTPAPAASEAAAPAIPSGEMAAPALPGMENPASSASAAVPGASVPSVTSAETAPPPLPGMENTAPTASVAGSTAPPPPAMPGENPPTTSNVLPSETAASSVPVPPEVSGQAPPQPPGIETAATTSSAVPPPPAGGEIIPPPPDLNEQIASAPPVPQPPAMTGQENQPPTVPPMPAASTAQAPAVSAAPNVPAESNPMPPMPAASSVENTPVQNQVVPTPIPPAEETEEQAKTLKALQGVNGDIDGMQAPPLEVNPDLSNSSTSSTTTKKKATSNTSNNLDLPPLQDSDVVPPKDLDLPPTDDLGNINLNSPSK